MASFTLGPDPRFPAGTELVVYEDGTLDRPPAKDSITTGTVGDTGLVTFDGLASNTRYVAGILDGGGWRAAAFTTGPEPQPVVGEQWPVNLRSFDVGRPDDTAAFQAAIDRAQDEDRPLYIPGGTYTLLGTLTYNPNLPLHVYGDGMDATVLSWPTDLGSGQYAFKRDGTADSSLHHPAVRDLQFLGRESSFTMGTPPCLMYGPELGSRMCFERVKVKSFYAPVRSGDHQVISRCVFTGCHYNLLTVADPSGAKGNLTVEASNLDGATMANIAVANNIDLSSDRFRDTHFGFAPYGVYGETGGTGNFMSYVLFDGCDFESQGNGVIFQGQTRSAVGLEVHNCSSSFSDTYKIAATARDYGIAVNILSGFVCHGSFAFLSAPPATARVMVAGGAEDIRWLDMTDVISAAQSDGIPILTDPNFGGVVDCEWQGAGARGRLLYNGQGGALAQGDLVSQSSANDNNVLKSTTLPPVGVVVVGATDSHTILPVAQSGRVTVLTNSAAGIARGDRLKLDTTNAGKAAKAAASDADQIGYCRHVTDTTHVIAYLTKLG